MSTNQRDPAADGMSRDNHDFDRTLTSRQVNAARTIMRLLVEDDLARGISPRAQRLCDACQQARPAPGSVQYGERHLCNDCATAYELARMQGDVESEDDFVRSALGDAPPAPARR